MKEEHIYQEGSPLGDIFENNQVTLNELPEISNLSWTPLERKYKYSNLIGNIIFFIIAIAIVSVLAFVFQIDFMIEYYVFFAAGLVLFLVFLCVISIVSFRYMSYAIRDRDIVYNKGFIWRSSTVIPFNRVQHCEVTIGPIDRIFGLSELKIFTAGGQSSDLKIPGLFPETSHRIKDFIVNKTNLYGDEEE